MRSALIVSLAGLAMAWSDPAMAATATAGLGVQMAVTSICIITSSPALDFGQIVFNKNINGSTTLGVSCSPGTSYTIGLDAGIGAGASGTLRRLTLVGGTRTLNYYLATDSALSNLWGNTVGTNTVSGVGTGSQQNYTIYGRVPFLVVAPAGNYVDTVTITVSY